VNRRPPPPGLIASAEQDHHAMRNTLYAFLPTVRRLLARSGVTEVETVAEVWITLLYQEPRRAAFLGATAIVQLANALQPEARRDHDPGVDHT
jgi:hypothetical protein